MNLQPSTNLKEEDALRLKAFSESLSSLGDFWLEEMSAGNTWVVLGRKSSKGKDFRRGFVLLWIFYSPEQGFTMKASSEMP